MTNTYFTSDLHFCHDREFIWGTRGFNSCDEMNNTIIERWNNVVTDNDTVYILGDLMLGDSDKGVDCINNLKGTIVLLRGNHDTDERIRKLLSRRCSKEKDIYGFDYAKQINFFSYNLFLTHYPCFTGSLEVDNPQKH